MANSDREILRLALPSILANLTVPLVGMVDIAVAGHLHSLEGAASFIGGISIGSLLFDLLYWNFAFLRVSTGGLVAQGYGARDFRGCADVFLRSISLALLLSLVLLALQWPFQKLAFLFVSTSPQVHELALKYFFIRIWAAPATLSLMAFRGWFVGMQDSVSSMLTDLVVNGVNIVSSIVLTLGVGSWKGMGFGGIALGTVIAQYCGVAFALGTVLLKYWKKVFAEYDWSRFRELFASGPMRRFMSMNGDLMVRSLCFIAIYVGFTTISARYGDLILSSGAILMKILMIFSYFTDGFAYAGEALTGRFIGEGNPALLHATVRRVFLWSMAVAVLFVFVYLFAGEWIVRLMTSDEAVVRTCMKYLGWLVLMPPLGCAAFTWDGIYEGATQSRSVRDAMVAAFLSFFAVWFLLRFVFSLASTAPDGSSASLLSMHLLLAAYFAHLLARTLLLTARRKKAIYSF